MKGDGGNERLEFVLDGPHDGRMEGHTDPQEGGPISHLLQSAAKILDRIGIATQDDLIRRTVIMELMCQFQLSVPDLEEKYHLGFDLDFNDYFAQVLPQLDALEADGLIKRWGDGIEVTAIGRLLIRNIASVFDTYLIPQSSKRFSKSL